MNVEVKPGHMPVAPRAVREAAEAAEAAHRALLGIPDPTVGADPNAPGNISVPMDPGPGAPRQSELPLEVTTSPAAAPTPAPAANTDPASWEHKFNSLKGKHDQQTAEANAELQRLQRLVTVLSAAPPPGTQPQPPAAGGNGHTPVASNSQITSWDLFKPENLQITEAEKNDFGEDMISVARRAAAAGLAGPLQDVLNRVQQMEARMSGMTDYVRVDAWQTAQEHIAREVPDWLQVNVDPVFLAWLAVPDTLSGVPRKQMLDMAVAANDGARIAAFFKAFKRDSAAPGTAPNGQDNPAAGRTSLADLAAPGRGIPGTPSGSPAAGGKPVVTRAFINEFSQDITRGKYRNYPAEKARIEREIDAAVQAAAAEGRPLL